MPDYWEKIYSLDFTVDDSASDHDADGVTAGEEFSAGTSPVDADSDSDGMDDNFEILANTDPRAEDSLGDIDGDGLTNGEEYEWGYSQGVKDIVSTSIGQVIPDLWLGPGNSNRVQVGGEISTWFNQGIESGVYAKVPNNQIGPLVLEDEVSGFLPFAYGPGNLKIKNSDVFSEASGTWSVMMVLRPRALSDSKTNYSILGNSIWQQSGFRLTFEQNSIRLSSTQSENSMDLYTSRFVEEDELVVLTVLYDHNEKRASIYLNGEFQKSRIGEILPAGRELWLGRIQGMSDVSEFDLLEFMAFSEYLNPTKRYPLEQMLMGKYLGEGPMADDGNDDGVPDWFGFLYPESLMNLADDTDGDGLTSLQEAECRTNPLVADSDGDGVDDRQELILPSHPWLREPHDQDGDGDGLTFFDELGLGTDPGQIDTDGDGIDDGAEMTAGTDPLMDDDLLDSDYDGVSDRQEVIDGSDPFEWVDADMDGMHDRWEQMIGLDSTVDDSLENADGDALSNIWEYLVGGDPMTSEPICTMMLSTGKENQLDFEILHHRHARPFYEMVVQEENEGVWQDLDDLILIPRVDGGGGVGSSRASLISGKQRAIYRLKAVRVPGS